LFRPSDFFEDIAGRFGPDECLGVGIVVLQVFHDGALSSGTLLKALRRMRLRVISAKTRSTILSQTPKSA
jgi:hypothetical protein